MPLSTFTSQEIEHLTRLIRGIKVAMFTTVCADGSLHSRPMATQEAFLDCSLWFFTRLDAPKVNEIENEYHVNVSYADPTDHRYVSVSGRASLVRDREKIEELWNPDCEAWFPQGIDDPQLALLRVDATKAEYWDFESSTMLQLDGFGQDTKTYLA